MFSSRLALWSVVLWSCTLGVRAYCPNDEDLQRHRCTCSLANSYIQCSSFPEQCRTCYQYQRLFFDEHVEFLPVEAFRSYDLFRSSNPRRSFTIQFARLDRLSSNAFSKIEIEQNQTLEIKVSKYTSALLPTRLFEDVTLQAKASFDMEIFNVTSPLFTIEQYVFDGMKLAYQSQFRLAILSAKETIEFQSNAGSILLSSYATMDLYFSNFHRVIFDEHSFDHITQEHSSQLRLNFDRFNEARLEHRSFIDLHQLDQSTFHLTLSNFHRLIIEQTLFETITQLKSSLIFSVFNLTEDLCLPARMFSQIQQDMNSTFQFQVQYAKNILFQSNTVMNVSQRAQSSLSMVLINTLDVYFAEQSISNFHQEDRSLLDIWVKSGRNLIFEDYAIENVDIWRSSLMRIGFQYSSGTLQMATNAFMNINEGQGGELLFQLINASDFYFRFNQSFQLQRLEIVDRLFTDEADLCRLMEIPSHLPVKLLSAQPCSCPVFYLYRRLRHTFKPSLLKELVPSCYSNMSLDRLEYEEKQCSFAEHTRHCQQMQGQVTIEVPKGLCHRQIGEKSVHHGSYSSSIGALSCLISILALIYFLSTQKRRAWVWSVVQRSLFRSRRQKLAIFAADSYQQLTSDTQMDDQVTLRPPSNRMMKIMVRYNSSTEQSQPHLHSSDFLVENATQPDEDHTLRLNTNPLSDLHIDSCRPRRMIHRGDSYLSNERTIEMITALGHCEDPACAKSSSGQELVRLFRCSIHCDRLLCLFHLNAHDVYYEEEKKQNDVVLTELQNSLTLYQSIFEQQIQTYRELVHQASSILLHNTSSIVPIEQIRPVLENIQKAIAFLQHEKVIIKNESTLDITEPESEKLDMNLLKDLPTIKKEPNETAPKVVVRIERVDCHKDTPVQAARLPSEQTNRNPPAPSVDRPQTFRLKESVQVVSSRSAKEAVPSPKRTRAASPVKKKCERVKKKPDKTVAVKRLQT